MPGRVLSQVSHNLAGQRLGRKGQETRERILTAALRLLDTPDGPPVNFTNIAREASIKLTNIYLYFPDFGDLVLAALTRVMEDAEDAFVHLLRSRWPDDNLQSCALVFLRAHYDFWYRHSRLLHIRNHLSDEDPRILEHRQKMTIPLLELLSEQMDCTANPKNARWHLMPTVVLAGFERVATLVTAPFYEEGLRDGGLAAFDDYIDALMQTEARLMELAIRDARSQPGAASRLCSDNELSH